MKRTVFITGCSAGFGKVTAELLAEKGYTVLAGIRNSTTENRAVSDELTKKGNIEVVELDLTSVASISAAVELVKDRQIDVLINNAGVCGIGFTELHTVDKMKKVFDVNVFGLYELTRQMIPSMRERKGGLIISVTSIVGRVVMPLWGVYCASKFAVEALAETWRYELMPLGIDSVIVEPGPHPSTSMGSKMEAYSAQMPSMELFQQYGFVAQSLQKFGAQLQEAIANGTDQKPVGVAEAIVQLIEKPMGQRPMRTVVDNQLQEVLAGLNNYTDAMYRQMYS